MTTKKPIPKPKNSDAKSKTFTRGFGLAIAEMIRHCPSNTFTDVLRDAGYYSIGEFVAAGVDPSDVREIKRYIPRAPRVSEGVTMNTRFTTKRGARECGSCSREIMDGTVCVCRARAYPVPKRAHREPRPRCGKCCRRHDMTLACLTASGRPVPLR